ncbi:cytochrome P450 [Hyalangium versicolor]|uniref:cytochrome P450 n=1 Tax=Hyalangium versicolor TaxID=2861190 RepID=UPI001CCCCE92|nr:cytochrome P450 [Hyalangium versicolor]
MAKTPPHPPGASEGRKPLSADQCPHLGREYNHFAGPHLENPYPFFEQLRKEAPVTFNPMLGMWLISRYDDVISVLNNPTAYSSAGVATTSVDRLTPEAQAILGPGPIIHDSPLNMDPPVHTRMKRLLQRGFTLAKVSRQEERVRQLTNALIDGFIHEGRVDLVQRFTHPLPAQVILNMVGVPQEDVEKVRRWSGSLFGLIFADIPPTVQPAMARDVVEYRNYCTQLIEQRRRQPQEDLTSDLVQAEPDGEALTMPELISLIGGSLLAAGHETTSAQLSIAVKNLLEHPERWQQLREDRTLIPKALEECMRLEGVAPGMVRTAIQDVEVGGVLLPKGSRLFLVYGSANRDEAHFKDPEHFDPHRENMQHLNFSRGIHFCLGAPLARLELRVALEQLIERIPGMRLVPGQDYGYHQEMLILRAIRQLQVEWTVS